MGFLGSGETYQTNTDAEKAKVTALCQVRAGQSEEAVLCCTTSIRVVAKGSCCCWDRIPKYAYGSRLGILRALDEALNGQSSTEIPVPLKSSAVYYFGSLQKASVAAKKDRATSPKARITTALSRVHRAKQSLAYAELRRDNLPLVRAAEKQFGSWG